MSQKMFFYNIIRLNSENHCAKNMHQMMEELEGTSAETTEHFKTEEGKLTLENKEIMGDGLNT